MHAELYLNGKKVNIGFDLGWYPGNNFTLLSVDLFEDSGADIFSLFSIQITKFMIGVWVEFIG